MTEAATTTRRLERAGWLLALKDIYDKVCSAEAQLVDAFEARGEALGRATETSAMLEVAGIKTAIEELREWDYADYDEAA